MQNIYKESKTIQIKPPKLSRKSSWLNIKCIDGNIKDI